MVHVVIYKNRCWLNFSEDAAIVTIVPIGVAAWLAVILTEAATMKNKKRLPLTPRQKYFAALYAIII